MAPYPPPPPPPTLGIFQGIGLVPELPSLVGNYFLTNSGGLTVWEPVSGGVLPDMSGHAGAYLTTNGVVASWSVLPPIATNNIHDVRRYGAVPNDPTNDVAQAFYAALQAWSLNSSLGPNTDGTNRGGIYFPEGVYYSSLPLCPFTNCNMFGDSPELSIISTGDTAVGHVQAFAGTMVYGTVPYSIRDPGDPSNLPQFVASPVTGGGQALVIPAPKANTSLNYFPLSDAWCWNWWLGQTMTTTSFGLQFWFKVTATPAAGIFTGIIGSAGPNIGGGNAPGTNGFDVAWGVYAECTDGVHFHFKAYLTTASGWVNVFEVPNTGIIASITSTDTNPNTWHHFELAYDGAHFDFYLDGVNQGHVSATGPVLKNGWECVSIGGQGPEFLNPPANGCVGAMASLRLSNIPRHTGTGSFTPPTAQYAWDSNTYALYNWDMALPTVTPPGGYQFTLPFLPGQVVMSTDGFAPSTGPITHYIRIDGVIGAYDSRYHDFALSPRGLASGLIVYRGERSKIQRVWVNKATQFGLRFATDTSFYCYMEDCYVGAVMGVGFSGSMDARKLNGIACGIGLHLLAGVIDTFEYQPVYTNFLTALIGGSGGGVFELMTVRGINPDAEGWTFTRQLASGAVIGGGNAKLFEYNLWDGTSSSCPPLVYLGQPSNYPSSTTHINDTFIPMSVVPGRPAPPPAIIKFIGGAAPTNKVQLINCTVADNNSPKLPLSSPDSGWVTTLTGFGTTNQSGISTGAIAANNLSGTFTILHGFTRGAVNFSTPEVNGDYELAITPKSYEGSAPAAGSTRVKSYTTGTSGFAVFVEVDPGGTCQLTFSWVLIRSGYAPLYHSYLPTIPSSIANPIAGTGSNVIAVGVTFVPPPGQQFTPNALVAYETLVEAGGTVGASDWWEISALTDSFQRFEFSNLDTDIFSAYVANGRLLGLLSPGAHNLALYYDGGQFYLFTDGTINTALGNGNRVTAGLPAATIYIGQRFDASQALASGTLRNLKVGRRVDSVLSDDSDIGPGEQAQALFFGDEWTTGIGTSGGAGGFGCQVAANRYGTTYYHMAWINSGRLLAGPPHDFNQGLVVDMWNPWAGASTAPTFTGACILAGFHDIFDKSETGANVFAALKSVLEGSKAYAIWNAPTSGTSPLDMRAFAYCGMPFSGPSATYSINGRSFLVNFNVDSNIMVNDLIAQMVADGPTNTLCFGTNYIDGNSNRHAMKLTIRQPGSAGNAIVLTSNQAGGAGWYGNQSGLAVFGSPVTCFGGQDTTCVINEIIFAGTFDTNTNTTINNLIALIAADPTIGPLVNCTNLGGTQMKIEAASAGWAGNNIRVTGNGLNVPGGAAFSAGFPTLIFGANGAITSGIPSIVLCTVPPGGTYVNYSAGKETQRQALNTLIRAYVGAGVTIADVDATVRDGGTPQNLLPAYDTGSGYLNATGQTALYGLINPLLP